MPSITHTYTLTEIRILFCGSRSWDDTHIVSQTFDHLDRQFENLGVTPVVIHGAARGADTICGEEAKRRGWQVLEFPADWAKHGRAAGPIRNKQMLEEGKPSMVVAFTYDLESSKGTANMVKQAMKADIPVVILGEEIEQVQLTLVQHLRQLAESNEEDHG